MMLGDAATSICVGDIVYEATMRANHSIESARDEFKRSVNPDELRSWVLAQFRKHPGGGCIEEAVHDWPETFPQLPTRRFLLSLYPSSKPHGFEPRLEARLRWGFFDQNLTVTVLLKSDGTPADVEDEEWLPTAQKWAKGISFRQPHND
ncbi:hypothetical protein DES53_102969 [Roseimicrobium gellanilyticum]|uniref:Uncharacterized protein n=1 Tax=Roseimicrobium gellanilyticum TaxID=748857 RepID=A0A366HU18_9BACT|nr:hypothetical protein [Roseimicrobium gellanilyticum]RBP46578.1 hypothetical protein DES53_102969 [Roseimicrobium gellanilyticum]